VSLLDRFIEVRPLEPDPRVAPHDWLEPEWLGFRHFSATSLRMLSRCPEQFRNRYVLHKKERPSAALTIGSGFHSALKFNYSQKVDSHEDRKLSEVIEYLQDEGWPKVVADDGGVDEIRWDDGQTPDDGRRDAERMTSAYYKLVVPRVQPITAEQKFSVRVPNVQVPIIGYIDQETETEIIDTKTGKQVQRRPDGGWRFQGRIYQLVSLKPVHFHSVSRAKTPSIQTPLDSEEMVVSLNRRQNEATQAIVQDFAAQVEFFMERYGPENPWPQTGLFNSLRGGDACNFCGFRKTCIAWQGVDNIPANG